MLPLAQPGLTVPAVAGRGLNEWLGNARTRSSNCPECADAGRERRKADGWKIAQRLGD